MDFITENGLNLFGIEFIPPKKRNESDPPDEIESFVEPSTEDGSDIVVSAGAHQIAYLDLTNEAFSDIARIKKYRELAMIPEVDQAIEDIVSEAVVSDEELAPVRILFDDYDENEKNTYMSDKLKKSIENEFEYLMELLHFNTHGHDIFRQWYIDGRIVYHEIINEESKKEKGIVELRNFDPINIKKIKEVEEKIHPETGARLYTNKEEYFVYSERTESSSNKNLGFSRATKDGRQLRISKDAIAYCTSGLLDEERKNVISFLHKAIKPANQLNMLENALVIYMLARAPERRVFYVDVGSLPTKKAEEYLNKTIAKFRNKISFDAKTGEIRDQRNAMAMVEDFWLPRCLSLDTKIELMSGDSKTLSQLIEDHENDIENWTYSVSPKGEVVPGLISWAGLTRENAQMVKVTLDNGKSIKCTPDHKFILRDGTKIEAKDLSPNDSLMPFYKDEDEKVLDNYSDNLYSSEDIKNRSVFIVYKTTNLINNKFYIGKHKQKDLKDDSYLGSGSVLKKAIEKYGKENFKREILFYSFDEDEAFVTEEKMIAEVFDSDDCYNLSKGGRLGASGVVRSDEYKQKMSDLKKGEKKTEDHKKKLSESGKAFFQTPEGLERRKQIVENNLTNPKVIKGFEKARLNSCENRAKLKESMTDEEYKEYCKEKYGWIDKLKESMTDEEYKEYCKEKCGWLGKLKETMTDEEYKEYCKRYSSVKTRQSDKATLSKEEYERKYNIGDYNQKRQKVLAQFENVNKDKVVSSIINLVESNPKINTKEIWKSLTDEFPVFSSLKKLRKYVVVCTPYVNLSHLIVENVRDEFVTEKRHYCAKHSNHKVASIEWLSETENTGTLTIDQDHIHHDYHNFATSAGVFIMNSSTAGRSGTEISTLSGGTSLASNSEYIDYFKKKLFRALNVPLNRLEQEAQFSIGRASEITRDEVKFAKFVSRLRRRFSELFYQLLRTQLLLKNIVSIEEWDSIKQHIRFDFIRDNHFTELKEAEIIRERLMTLRELDEYTGRYFSKQWVLKNVLRQSESEIEEIQKEIEKEKEEEPNDNDDDLSDGMSGGSRFPVGRF